MLEEGKILQLKFLRITRNQYTHIFPLLDLWNTISKFLQSISVLNPMKLQCCETSVVGQMSLFTILNNDYNLYAFNVWLLTLASSVSNWAILGSIIVVCNVDWKKKAC